MRMGKCHFPFLRSLSSLSILPTTYLTCLKSDYLNLAAPYYYTLWQDIDGVNMIMTS